MDCHRNTLFLFTTEAEMRKLSHLSWSLPCCCNPVFSICIPAIRKTPQKKSKTVAISQEREGLRECMLLVRKKRDFFFYIMQVHRLLSAKRHYSGFSWYFKDWWLFMRNLLDSLGLHSNTLLHWWEVMKKAWLSTAFTPTPFPHNRILYLFFFFLKHHIIAAVLPS